ncbi:MAG: hypothetical protein ACRDG7_05610 [Candidatus Limnocylindria bacterium]
MTIRWRPLILALSTILGAVLPAAPAALAAPPISPLVGETVLTDAERQHALDTMRQNERAALRPAFDLPASDILVTSYERRLVRIVTTPDGRQHPEEVVKARQLPGSGLRVPNEAVAGSAKKEDLYISLTVTRTRSTRPYEWRVWTYAEWRDGLRGMNPTNASADSMAVAWAGGASLHSQAGSGERYSHWPCADEELDEWPSDGTPNVGTAWSFHEFGRWGCPMHWALADIRIRQDRLIGRTDNLVYRYYHTYGGLDYSLSFSRSPGISISPTKEQWSLALFGAYTH